MISQKFSQMRQNEQIVVLCSDISGGTPQSTVFLLSVTNFVSVCILKRKSSKIVQSFEKGCLRLEEVFNFPGTYESGETGNEDKVG